MMDLIEHKLPIYIKKQIPLRAWKEEEAEHKQEAASFLDIYLQRRSQQHKDPVMDFLFEYYAFRPSHLKRWSPGLGALLIDGASEEWALDEMEQLDHHSFLDINHFSQDRLSSLQWILEVLENSANQPPAFGCFGMHEWAMVYKRDRVRHNYLSLRMDKKSLTSFVESRPLVCTHFDAFRFFTDEAKPQNKFELNRNNFSDMEQPGCLHTNMDLYKWAFKMYPWISSKSIFQAFKLAIETRVIDMKASPYDLHSYGLEPIKIETNEGRREYMQEQKNIFEQSKPVRKQLIEEYKRILEAVL